MASDSIVRIVINAVDKYSGVLTGLNQGLELVGKAFAGLSTVATGSFDAIKAGLESVSEGGDFLELRRQFESTARSLGQDGQKIVDIFDDVGDGTIAAAERVKLASKAVSSGLSGEEIRAAVEYTKKWTEATGDDFAGMSETVFEAFNSGKFSILKQMGLLIDKSTSASDVLAQMRDNMDLFSDTGGNVADSMTAISTAVSDFVLFSKAAIANSDYLQEALEYVSDSARTFVKSMDFSTITQVFDTIIKASLIVFEAVKQTFSGIGETIYSVFQSLRTESGIKEFFESIGTFSASAYKVFSTFADGVLDSASLVVGAFGNMVKLSGQGFQELKYLAASAIAGVSEIINKGVAGWAKSILEFVQSSPDLATFMPGIDSISNAMTGLIKTSAKSKKMYDEFRDSVLTEDSFGKTIEGWGESMESFALSMDTARQKSKATGEELYANLEKGFKGFEVVAKKPFISDDIIKKTAEQGERLRELLRAQRDKQDLAEEAADKKKFDRQEQQNNAAAERAQRQRESAMRETMRDIEEIERKMAKTPGYSLTVDERRLMAAKDQIKKTLADLDREAQRSRLTLALDASADPSKIKQLKDELSKIGVGADGKLTIKSDIDKPKPIPVQVELKGGPTFFKELLQNMIVWLKGERIPLAFTAVPG